MSGIEEPTPPAAAGLARDSGTSVDERRLPRLLKFQLSQAYFIVLLASVVYSVVFGYICLVKYTTFNTTFADLGLENQIYWLTLHGQYFSSGFSAIYPFPYEALSTFILLPLYAIYPHPATLLIIQSALIGFAALPLYAIVHRLTNRQWLGVVLALAFLAYYPLEGANMFDFHPESMFPIFTFLAIWSWLTKRYVPLVLFTIAASLVDIVGLDMGILLVLWFAYQEWAHPAMWGLQRTSWALWIRRAVYRYGILLVGLFVLAVWLLKFQPQTYAGINQRIILTPGGLFTGIYSKFALFLFLLAPIAFLPLVDPDSSVTIALPYVGFVFFANTGAAQTVFYEHYTLLPVPILFLATTRALARWFDGAPSRGASGARPTPRPSLCGQAIFHRTRRLRRPGIQQTALVIIFTSVLAVVYSPLSPANGLVPGGIYSGSYHLSTDLGYTQHDAYLWHILGMIPPAASVLTQNSIPQLTGRTYYGVAQQGEYLTNLTYEYILGDGSLNTTVSPWSGYTSILPFIEGAFQNRTYGILAYADGILLLKHGYIGSPQYFVQPPPTIYPGTSLDLFSGSPVPGTSWVVHDAQLGNSSYFFYGPYADQVLPGTYAATFFLRINEPANWSGEVVTVQVTSFSTVLEQRSLNTSSFDTTGWTNVTLNYTITEPTDGIQYRGVNVTSAATLILSNVDVVYSAPL